MAGQTAFEPCALWLSGVKKESSNSRLIHRVNYMKEDNLLVETPPLCVLDMKLVLEDGGTTQKILLKTKLVRENLEFKRVIRDIDDRIQAQASFSSSKSFIPSFDYYGVLSFFIPVHQNEVSVLVMKDGQPMSLKSLTRSAQCRLVLLLSHVEAVHNSFFPVWNVIQMKLVSP